MALSDRELDLLALESCLHLPAEEWRKAAVIRELFDVTLTRYAQLLNVAAHKPEAVSVAPQLVHRLERIQAKRSAGDGSGIVTRSPWRHGPKPLAPSVSGV